MPENREEARWAGSPGDGSAAEDAKRTNVRGALDSELAAALSTFGAELRRIEPNANGEQVLFSRAEAMGLLPPEAAQSTPSARSGWQRVLEGLSVAPRWAMAGVTLAFMAAVAFWTLAHTSGEVPALESPAIQHASAAPTRMIERSVHQVTPPAMASARVAKPSRKPAQSTVTRPPGPAEAEAEQAQLASARYSEFVPVGSAVPLRPDEFVQAVRVRIGAEDFWRLGVPMAPTAREDRITADFLVGEDGRARAVRFVSTNR